MKIDCLCLRKASWVLKISAADLHLREKRFILTSFGGRQATITLAAASRFMSKDAPAMNDLSFVHQFHHPDAPDGSVLVLLHGTGGNEQDLIPLARRVAPHATLLGVRGRSDEEGITRWFRRLSMARFDQRHIRVEAKAFACFMKAVTAHHGLASARMTFLGYSNGANFIAALLGLHTGLVHRAIMLRPMQPLEVPPQVDLSATHVLLLAGATDPYGKYAPAFEAWLHRCHAQVDARLIYAGHQLVAEDMQAATQWLAAQHT